MSGLNSQQRRELYAMISDDTLAGMLVAMKSTERTKLLQEVEQLDQTLVDRVLRYIRSRSIRQHGNSDTIVRCTCNLVCVTLGLAAAAIMRLCLHAIMQNCELVTGVFRIPHHCLCCATLAAGVISDGLCRYRK